MSRLGRKTRIGGKQREILWAIFERVRAGLAERKVVTWAEVFGALADRMAAGEKRPFDYAIVDECQDLGVAEARFLGALAAGQPNGLFFAGDLGQRIFQQPFSWKALVLNLLHRLVDGKVIGGPPLDTPQALALHREPKANFARYDGLCAEIAGGRHAS